MLSLDGMQAQKMCDELNSLIWERREIAFLGLLVLGHVK